MPVLQQRRPIAELTGDLEVLCGRIEVALLAQDVREADVQVAGAGERRSRVALGRGQGAFVEPARLDRAPARQPHVRQYDGRAELVRDHPGCVQAADRLGERVDGGAEVAGSPCRQAEEASGGTAREVVLRPGQRECPAGVRHGAVDVAAGLGDRGAVDLDHGRQGADLDLAIPGRVGQRARRGDGRWRHRVETGLGDVEPRLDSVEVALGEPAPPHECGEQRSMTDDVVGQRDQPVAKGAVLASSAQVGLGELDEVGGVLVVAARDRVPYGIGEQPVLGVPSAGRGGAACRPGRYAEQRDGHRNASAKRWW